MDAGLEVTTVQPHCGAPHCVRSPSANETGGWPALAPRRRAKEPKAASTTPSRSREPARTCEVLADLADLGGRASCGLELRASCSPPKTTSTPHPGGRTKPRGVGPGSRWPFPLRRGAGYAAVRRRLRTRRNAERGRGRGMSKADPGAARSVERRVHPNTQRQQWPAISNFANRRGD